MPLLSLLLLVIIVVVIVYWYTVHVLRCGVHIFSSLLLLLIRLYVRAYVRTNVRTLIRSVLPHQGRWYLCESEVEICSTYGMVCTHGLVTWKTATCMRVGIKETKRQQLSHLHKYKRWYGTSTRTMRCSYYMHACILWYVHGEFSIVGTRFNFNRKKLVADDRVRTDSTQYTLSVSFVCHGTMCNVDWMYECLYVCI